MKRGWYKAQEVADRYGVCYRTMLSWIKTGKIKAYRLGKEYRIAKEDLADAENRAIV